MSDLKGFQNHCDRLNVVVGNNPNEVIRAKLFSGFKRGVESSVRSALDYVGISGKDQDLIIEESDWK